jgi:D-inositol-3-phosphate glycosyltransferase
MYRLTVGIVEPIGGHGGMDYYDYGLCYGLGENDVQVIYYTSNSTNIRSFKNVKTRLIFRNMWTAGILIKTIKYIVGHIKAYFDLQKRGGQVVHLHFFKFRAIDALVLIIAKIFSFTIVATVHDVNSFDGRGYLFIETFCYNLIDITIVHNESSLTVLATKIKGRLKAEVIPHGNYLPFIIRTTPREQSKGIFTFLFFGQIKEVKGLDLLLESMSLLKKHGYNVRLIIAGKAWKSDLNAYTTLIQRLDISDIVITHFRYIPDSEILSLYNMADLVVLPYREIYQSGVLLLSMSYGRPVLCSDLEPFKEVIVDNVNGFLFRSEDVNNLFVRMAAIIDDRDRLNAIAENAFQLIKTKYNWIDIGAKTKSAYLDSIGH